MVQLQHQGMLMESVTRTQSNVELNIGGAGSGSARTKESSNIWDEEW
jgi:hypothetical protein